VCRYVLALKALERDYGMSLEATDFKAVLDAKAKEGVHLRFVLLCFCSHFGTTVIFKTTVILSLTRPFPAQRFTVPRTASR
jgi:hypothetical protein